MSDLPEFTFVGVGKGDGAFSDVPGTSDSPVLRDALARLAREAAHELGGQPAVDVLVRLEGKSGTCPHVTVAGDGTQKGFLFAAHACGGASGITRLHAAACAVAHELTALSAHAPGGAPYQAVRALLRAEAA